MSKSSVWVVSFHCLRTDNNASDEKSEALAGESQVFSAREKAMEWLRDRLRAVVVKAHTPSMWKGEEPADPCVIADAILGDSLREGSREVLRYDGTIMSFVATISESVVDGAVDMFCGNGPMDDIAMLANLVSQAWDVGIDDATAYDEEADVDYGAEDVLSYIRKKYGNNL